MLVCVHFLFCVWWYFSPWKSTTKIWNKLTLFLSTPFLCSFLLAQSLHEVTFFVAINPRYQSVKLTSSSKETQNDILQCYTHYRGNRQFDVKHFFEGSQKRIKSSWFVILSYLSDCQIETFQIICLSLFIFWLTSLNCCDICFKATKSALLLLLLLLLLQLLLLWL